MIKKGRNAPQEPAYTGPGVSELLKTSRERAGQELQTVSDVLRIRYVYLEAIEAGRYEDLPGKTYVVGFVRAYAEYLGLDAGEVVNRFKAEIDGLEGRSELMFPSPVTEQSVPSGAIIMIGLVILLVAYGGWYFLSSQDRSMAELVPDLPAKFAEMVDKVKDTKKAVDEEPKEEAVAENKPEEKPVEPVSQADTQDMAKKAMEAVKKAEEKEKAAAPVEVKPVETVKVEEKPEKKIEKKVEETVKKPVEKKKQETVEKTKAVVEKKKEEVTKKAEKKPAETVKKVEKKVEEKIAVAEKKPVDEVKPKVETLAETTVDVEEEQPAKPQPMTEKVLLKAIDYAWIQVTNDQGTVLHTQVLNEGDEYQVPATQGLILRTGNAGGLEIFVDGTKAPSIGEAGEVRRKVLMNPKKLLAGKAVES
ncbi:helix-turn-helix domain-containing protein [Terasakiella sp. SH-1]|uniref:helix-turn-helix domain-containing protein n=1 Tax=Terasakiella sp. SH-1 TaxID=2560057 RepID=UPI001073F689|nr:helix-turn-helix domain-containing protein [Terasakiella sp. SH-1]